MGQWWPMEVMVFAHAVDKAAVDGTAAADDEVAMDVAAVMDKQGCS